MPCSQNMDLRLYKIKKGLFWLYQKHKEVFRGRVFDKDGSGYVSTEELRTMMMQLGDRLTEEEAEDMIREADVNEDGMIQYSGRSSLSLILMHYIFLKKITYKGNFFTEFVKIMLAKE